MANYTWTTKCQDCGKEFVLKTETNVSNVLDKDGSKLTITSTQFSCDCGKIIEKSLSEIKNEGVLSNG